MDLFKLWNGFLPRECIRITEVGFVIMRIEIYFKDVATNVSTDRIVLIIPDLGIECRPSRIIINQKDVYEVND